MGWLAALGILLILGMIPIGASLRYREESFLLQLKIAGIPISLDLTSHKEKKEKPPKVPKDPSDSLQNPNAPKSKKKKPGIKALYEKFEPFIRLAMEFLGDLRRRLILDRVDCDLVLAGSDPCDLAILYGNTWAAMGNVISILERLFTIRSRDIQVQCDFTAEKTRVDARLDLHMTLGRILALLLGYGFRALKLLLNLKKRKGGALL